ncbi:MAG: hypothetical protein QM654_03880 [Dysgonamonadaceae bacterium]
MKKKIYACMLVALSSLSGYGQTWSTSGNSGLSASNFIGTTDAVPLTFKVNNKAAGYSGHGNTDYANVSFGYNSLNYPTSGGRNVALGIQALTNNSSGWSNIAIGYWALDTNTSGSENIAIGVSSMAQANGSTSRNIGIGVSTLKYNMGTLNTALGTYAAEQNTSGSLITAIGAKALLNNTTGTYNTAVGAQAMQSNTTGEINVGCGSGALYSNISGSHNTGVGNASLWSNTSGNDNTAIGDEALAGNLDGSCNVAIGTRALWCGDNLSEFTAWGHGSKNTATGWEAMRSLSSGESNSAYGYHSLLYTDAGQYNAAYGAWSLSGNTKGNGNTALGYYALATNTSGSYNTAVGYGADLDATSLTNATVIGYGASANRSNSVTIGNKEIASVGGLIGWSTLLKDEEKTNQTENVPGLSFIANLTPITFNIPNSTETHTGFLTQNVKSVADSIGYQFGGIDKTDNTTYGLRYSEFIGPLVMAIKELSSVNEEKDSIISDLTAQVSTLQYQLNYLANALNVNLPSGMLGNTAIATSRSTIATASLAQNYPNPCTQSTTIPYKLPDAFSSAQLMITNEKGALIQISSLPASEENSISINTSSFKTSGIYLYSLLVDGKLIDTKRMIVKI